MSLRQKLLLSFLCMAMLIALISVIAFRQQVTVDGEAAMREATTVATAITDFVQFDPGGPPPPLMERPDDLRQYVHSIHASHQRDISVVDTSHVDLADASPMEEGKIYPDPTGVITRTLQ